MHGVRTLDKPRAFVTVKRNGNDLVISSGDIGILKTDALLVPLPSYLRVVDANGSVISPSNGKQFLITTESFDPVHGVVEL